MSADPRSFQTHEVSNQTPPLVDYNLFAVDRALQEGVAREGADWANDALNALGTELGRAETIELARLANQHEPVLQAFDRWGRRQDEVEFHPAWHKLMAMMLRHGLHSGPWADPRPGAHVARAAGYLMWGAIENGTQCPTTMTYGSVPVLRREAELAPTWMPRLLSRDYDKRFAPIAEKTSALIGMGMTEKQGGSDVRMNETRAEAVGGGEYRLIGHKWFFSAPMCDGFLVLAQAPAGVTCFFLPRFRPDGSLNALRIQRLKDKLGNKSNASSEVEFQAASAWLVGEEGRGVPTIIEMGTYTRLDCALGTSGILRGVLAHALHHAAHRTAFQKKLVDQPLMAHVLADLAIEVEAAQALCLRLARAFDAAHDPAETAFRRIVTPAAKYFICKRGPTIGVEAMEVLGGNGYVEEGPLARAYRELPVNSIWEGSGNVMCLDVLRGLSRAPDSVAALQQEIAAAAGGDPRLDQAARDLMARFAAGASEAQARRLVERLVLVLQGTLLVRHAPPAVADAFCASRLAGDWGATLGTLPADVDARTIVDRAMPTI
jgi:putative acyl-CoA dehydrogenase